MSTPQQAPRSNGFLRTFAAAAVLGLILFAVLWYVVFSAVTPALIAGAGTGVLVVGGSTSDAFDWLLEMLSNIVLAVLGAIAAVFAAILSIFD
jgi:uncharacterized membrane protein YgcG